MPSVPRTAVQASPRGRREAHVATSATERSWCVVVPHHPRGARTARQRIVTELGPVIGAGLLADVVTVVAELVGNAVRHAEALPGGVVRVAWRLRPGPEADEVDVRVTDGGGPMTPRIRVVEVDSLDGRGLSMVAAVAMRWGFDRDGLGQSVWAQLSGTRRPAGERPADSPAEVPPPLTEVR